MVVKHLILESEDTKLLEKASKTTTEEGYRVNRTNKKVAVTYIKSEGLLAFIRNLG